MRIRAPWWPPTQSRPQEPRRRPRRPRRRRRPRARASPRRARPPPPHLRAPHARSAQPRRPRALPCPQDWNRAFHGARMHVPPPRSPAAARPLPNDQLPTQQPRREPGAPSGPARTERGAACRRTAPSCASAWPRVVHTAETGRTRSPHARHLPRERRHAARALRRLVLRRARPAGQGDARAPRAAVVVAGAPVWAQPSTNSLHPPAR